MMVQKPTYSRRQILHWGLIAGGAFATSPLCPRLLQAQAKDLLENYFKKYGRVQVYDSVSKVEKDGTVVEEYIPIICLYKRITQDGIFRPIYSLTNKENHAELVQIYHSIPQGAKGEMVWQSALAESKEKDFSGENVKDFERETAKIKPPAPGDYPCQLDDKYAGIVVNARSDGVPYIVTINRNAEISHLTEAESELKEYRMKYDAMRRLISDIRTISNDLTKPFFVLFRRANLFEKGRNREARIMVLVMMRDRDGTYRAVNGPPRQHATDLDGKPILDDKGNPKVIKGYEKALFSNHQVLSDLEGLINKVIREQQPKKMVVAPWESFCIPSWDNVKLEALKKGMQIDPKTEKKEEKLFPGSPTPEQLREWKKLTKPAVDSLKRPFIPYVPLDYLPDAFFNIKDGKKLSSVGEEQSFQSVALANRRREESTL